MPELGPFNHLSAPPDYWNRLFTKKDLSDSLRDFSVEDYRNEPDLSRDDAVWPDSYREDIISLDPYYRDRDKASSLGYTYDPYIAETRYREMRKAYEKIYDSMRDDAPYGDSQSHEFNRRYGTGRYFFDNSESPISFGYRFNRYAPALLRQGTFVDNSSPAVREDLVPLSYSRVYGWADDALQGTYPSYPNHNRNTSFTTGLINNISVGPENTFSAPYGVDLLRDAADAAPNWALSTFLGRPIGVSAKPNPLNYRSFASLWYNSLPYNGTELDPTYFDQLERYKAFGADLTGSVPLSGLDHEATIGVDKWPPELALVPSFASWAFLQPGSATQLGLTLGKPLSWVFKGLGKLGSKADALVNRVIDKSRAQKYASKLEEFSPELDKLDNWMPSLAEKIAPGVDRAAIQAASVAKPASGAYKAARKAIPSSASSTKIDLDALSRFNASHFGEGSHFASQADQALSSLSGDSGTVFELLLRGLVPTSALDTAPTYLSYFTLPFSSPSPAFSRYFSNSVGLGSHLLFPALYLSSGQSALKNYSDFADLARVIKSQPVSH